MPSVMPQSSLILVRTNTSQARQALSRPPNVRQALSETRLLMQEGLVQAAPLLKVFGVGRLLIDVVGRGVRHRGRLGRPPLPGALPRFVLLLPPPPPGLLHGTMSESER